ncbi:hypothetical protein ACFLZZ_00015 [Nanoarchaeota archaeon]
MTLGDPKHRGLFKIAKQRSVEANKRAELEEKLFKKRLSLSKGRLAKKAKAVNLGHGSIEISWNNGNKTLVFNAVEEYAENMELIGKGISGKGNSNNERACYIKILNNYFVNKKCYPKSWEKFYATHSRYDNQFKHVFNTKIYRVKS